MARMSLKKNNPKDAFGKLLFFVFPNLSANALSFIIEAQEFTTNVSNNFPINGSIHSLSFKSIPDKFEVA